MPTYAVTVEYDGAPFVGWQRQEQGLSVQQVLEAAAAALQPADAPPVHAMAAGRTDAGVHAAGQVVQVTVAREIAPGQLCEALNHHARPHPVIALRAAPAPKGWHARLSAVQRGYAYRILNRRARPALAAGQVWHIRHALDVPAMQAAAQMLIGRHDFSAYRAAACQAASPVRTLARLEVLARPGEQEIAVLAEARSFLHHQVRNLVGTLVEVGLGRRPVEWPRAVLDQRNRALAGQTAPAEGLCLRFVRYEPEPEWC
jgi:tRNA pseudouridine38-40 synthase